MKPFKEPDKNNRVRETVRTMNEWYLQHPDISRKYWSNAEFEYDVVTRCKVPYYIAAKVVWFIRADGSRDEEALRLWGFNKHTA